MNDNTARHLIRSALRISRDLQDATAVIRDHATSDEYRTLSRGVASAIQSIMVTMVDAPLATRLALRAEVEGQIERYGRYL